MERSGGQGSRQNQGGRSSRRRRKKEMRKPMTEEEIAIARIREKKEEDGKDKGRERRG